MPKRTSSKGVHWRGSNTTYIGNIDKNSCRKCDYYADGICEKNYIDLSIAGYNLFKHCTSFTIDGSNRFHKKFIQEEREENKSVKNNRDQHKIVNKDSAYLGYKVKLYDYQAKENIEYKIVKPAEVDIFNNMISIESPVAKALIGKGKGTTVYVTVPNGKDKYKIIQWQKAT